MNHQNYIKNGKFSIGTTTPHSKLTDAEKIHAKEVKVTINAGELPDYVFAKEYKPRSLKEVENFIKK